MVLRGLKTIRTIYSSINVCTRNYKYCLVLRLQELNVLKLYYVLYQQPMIKTQSLGLGLGLLKECLFVKLESSDYRIYWTKSAKLDQSKIRFDRLNLMQINFFAEFSNSAQALFNVQGFMFYSKYKRKNPSYVLEIFDVLCVESLVKSRGVYLHTHLVLSRSRFMSRTW